MCTENAGLVYIKMSARSCGIIAGLHFPFHLYFANIVQIFYNKYYFNKKTLP